LQQEKQGGVRLRPRRSGRARKPGQKEKKAAYRGGGGKNDKRSYLRRWKRCPWGSRRERSKAWGDLDRGATKKGEKGAASGGLGPLMDTQCVVGEDTSTGFLRPG